MPIHDKNDLCNLIAVAEASAQFHWGTKVGEVEEAARKLLARRLNPELVSLLEAKALDMASLNGSALEMQLLDAIDPFNHSRYLGDAHLTG